MIDIATAKWRNKNFELLGQLFPFVDIFIDAYSRVYPPDTYQSKFEREFIKKAGKEFWIYTCETKMIAAPVIDYYRLRFWKDWLLGADGDAFWTYACSLGDPLDLLDVQKGYGWDEGIVYYGKDPSIVIDSKRYESFREGVEDYCYLWKLKKLIDGKKDKGENVNDLENMLQQCVNDVLEKKDVLTIYSVREKIADTIEKIYQEK